MSAHPRSPFIPSPLLLWLGWLASFGLATISASGQAPDVRQPTDVRQSANSGDWSQWGGSSHRNSVSSTTGLPTTWDLGRFDYRTGEWLKGPSVENVKWVARLGSESYATPIVVGDKVFCATNNGTGYLQRYPAKVDLGCLLAFDRQTGEFLWQHSVEKLAAGDDVDWAEQGICSSPLVQRDRLWIVTNRGEVVCLDTEGFRDNANDGPVLDEPATTPDESDVVWRFDMMESVGSVQHNMASCSVTSVGDLLFVSTSNGLDGEHETIPAPEAPSFLALDKHSGKLIWADASPGENILHGQWGSPAAGVLGGVSQVIFPGGDGWLYSFEAITTSSGKPVLLWKFDCNPKRAVWGNRGRGDRNNIIATPVIHADRVYLATGQDPESGEGQGDLWCIDATRRGDVSSERVVDTNGNPVPSHRTFAVDEKAGQRVEPNPNSAAVWHYRGEDTDGDGDFGFEETMHRALGMATIADGLLVIGDYSGLIHCLDATTGRLLWTHDMLATVWGSALIADGKIYIGDEDGDVAVFTLSRDFNLLAENMVEGAIYGTPTAVDGILYISSRSHLVAIKQ